MPTVLVVDDKEMLRDSVGATLQRAGYTIVAAPGAQAALDAVSRRRPDAVVTDLKLPGMDGLALLERLRALDEDLPVVVMTAFGTVDTAVRAMTLGAYTYITKPFEGDQLIIAVKSAIEHGRLRRDNALLRVAADSGERAASPGEPAARPLGLDRLIGRSGAMLAVHDQIRAVARSQGAVLITGESGVGKEAVARAVHELSQRAAEPFVAVNCAALSESLLESELFGHERGAFTGAEMLRKGRFELADRGSLLLDEVSEVSPKIQAKLLRVLQERTLERVGSGVSIGVDVRIIATTNRDLPREVERGDFRADLFFRLNVLPVHVPPLRQRMEDLPTLARHFVSQVSRRDCRDPRRLSDEALRVLCEYSWPGNVRELQNICERAVVLSESEEIPAHLIRAWLTAPPPLIVTRPLSISSNGHALHGHANGQPAGADAAYSGETFAHPPIIQREPRLLEEIERQAIVETLRKFNGHRQKTAHALGIGVRTLGLKLKKWKEMQLVSPSL